MENQNQSPVDPTALALSRSIRKAEGGSYDNTSGDNGTSAGAYQFNNGKIPLKKGEIPANFKSWATEEGLDPNDFSQQNQDHVAYNRIKKDLDSGLSQSQIAAKWNSGLTSGWENHKGEVNINGKTIAYDTPAYVSKVQKYYQDEINGNGGSTQDAPKRKTFDDITVAPQTQTIEQPDQIPGVISQAQHGDYLGAGESAIRKVGSFLTGGGTETLGKSIGTLGGYIASPNKGQYDTSAPSIGDTTMGAIKTVGSAAGIKGSGTAIQGLLPSLISRSGTAIASEPITAILTKAAGKDAVTALSSAEKVNALTEALSTAEPAIKPIISRAIQEISPQVLKDAGVGSFEELNPKLAKSLGLAGGALKFLTRAGADIAGMGLLKTLIK